VTSDDVDAALADWFDEATHRRAPTALLDDFLAVAVATPQQPAWRSRLGSSGAASGVRGAAIRGTVALLVVVLGVVAVGLVGARVGSALHPTRNGSILAVRTTEGGGAAYVTMSPDGSSPQVVLESTRGGLGAFWSPDGGRLLLPELLLGGRITSAISGPDGTAKHVLPPDATLDLAPGAWTPDGAHVILVGWDDRDASRIGLYLTDDHGGDRRLITTSVDGRRQEVAAVSPDGRYVAFLELDPTPLPEGGSAGVLLVVESDGSGQRRLSPDGVLLSASTGAGRAFDWSPDARHLAFAATEGPGTAGRSAIFVVDVTGGDPAQVTDWGPRVVGVDWSPDGDWLLTGDAVAGAETIWRIRPDGRDRHDLWAAASGEAACCGTWSPDGRLVLFQRGASGARDLWTMDRDGVVQGQLTHDPGTFAGYDWGPASDD
jgi:WD40 repeat protein